METTTKKPNLFAAAKKQEPAKTESKSKTPSLAVPDDLLKVAEEYAQAKIQVKSWEGKMTMAEGILKSRSEQLYLEQVEKEKRHIGSFKVGTVTVSVKDQYKKLDDATADLLEAQFPDIIETTTTYGFDQTILAKYIAEISEALSNAGLPDEDLEKLIVKTETRSVKKGTIESLPTYKEQMRDIFQAIAPLVSCR
jgi:hypothetical protein